MKGHDVGTMLEVPSCCAAGAWRSVPERRSASALVGGVSDWCRLRWIWTNPRQGIASVPNGWKSLIFGRWLSMKLLAVIRILLEIFGISFILAAVALWMFPGVWRGAGVGEAIESANRLASSTQTAPSPIAAPADLMALLLMVATIVLTAVAFLVSIGAFFGFAAIRDHAIATAAGQIAPLRTDVDLALKRLDTRFDELRITLEAERSEAQGLAVGQGADEMAEAISGNPTTITP